MPHATDIETTQDVVDFLTAQHRRIEAKFDEVISVMGSQRERSFLELRRLLAVHEAAEEAIVHPTARRAVPGGETIVAARLDEEHAAKQLLADLEGLDVESTEFETSFNRLREDVLAHAESEEASEFDALADSLDASRLERMRLAVEVAEAIAPTRPHAKVQTPVEHALTAPFATMLDRVRDALAH